MGSIYIGGGPSKKKSGGLKWKIYFFLILFLVIIGSTLKVAGPTLVEKWINEKGAIATGYAFSIRDVDISLEKRQMILRDAKIFNKKTNSELLEAPNLTINLNWQDLVLAENKKLSVYADEVDLILSKDLSSEMERIQTSSEKHKNDFYLSSVEGQIGKLNIIEQKEDMSRTVLKLKDVNVKVKDVTLLSINDKTEFRVSSDIVSGGKLILTGKTSEGNGSSTPWSINGSLKQVPASIFNKIAGDKLPFSFIEPKLNAEISASSSNGKISGEIAPDITRLNLLEEKPGIPTQSISRALNEELTFTLPFTLKDELKLQYADTYRKLKAYRKYPTTTEKAEPKAAASVSQTVKTKASSVSTTEKTKKPFSFWPF